MQDVAYLKIKTDTEQGFKESSVMPFSARSIAISSKKNPEDNYGPMISFNHIPYGCEILNHIPAANRYVIEVDSPWDFVGFMMRFGDLGDFVDMLKARDNPSCELSVSRKVRTVIGEEMDRSLDAYNSPNAIPVYFDTEFNSETVGAGNIELISLGLTNHNETIECYAVSDWFNLTAAKKHDFLPGNVLNNLGTDERLNEDQFKARVSSFFKGVYDQSKLQTSEPVLRLVALNGCYDLVAMHSLYGGKEAFEEEMKAIGFKGIEFWDVYDIAQIAPNELDRRTSLRPEDAHNALSDCRDAIEIVNKMFAPKV